MKQTLYLIGSKYFPSPIKNIYKAVYFGIYCNVRWYNVQNKSIILNSIPKSGTNYFRICLANYLKIYFGGVDSPISYKETNNSIFPNNRGYLFAGATKYKKPDIIINHTQYKDFVDGHSYRGLEFCKSRIVALYRNPLDTIVSRFYYTWRNRPAREQMYESPREVIDIVLEDFIRQYIYIRETARRKPNVIMVSYEDMIMNPVPTFSMVFRWLSLPIGMEELRKAITFSSIDTVRKEEERDGPIHSPIGFSGHFTRSGKIGQWKEYLNEKDIDYITQKLADNNIRMDEFIIE